MSPKYQFFTLEALSQEAGFRSKSSFNLIFKKHTSMTPSQYKKRKT
ncbi:MAG: AraC family transcriptional regulator [Flavobacteriaceae bacterium]|nr:AraC family transcriptional regulator [Flavobacteriaceae bacterium]